MTGDALFLDPLWDVTDVRADFVTRVPGVAGSVDKAEAVSQLQPFHERAVNVLGFEWPQVRRAEQVHGAGLAIVGAVGDAEPVSGVDGLLTADAGICLGIYVADCAAIYLVDRRTRAIGLLHSGRKGSEANIVGAAVEKMGEAFGTKPEDLVVSISPCIRPPVFEVDFAAIIRADTLAAGVPERSVFDSGACTTHDLARYYSYRVERGHTGRMLALLGRAF